MPKLATFVLMHCWEESLRGIVRTLRFCWNSYDPAADDIECIRQCCEQSAKHTSTDSWTTTTTDTTCPSLTSEWLRQLLAAGLVSLSHAKKTVRRSAMARECHSNPRTQPRNSLLNMLLAEVEAVEAVQAMQRCFQNDVQQCLDACPRRHSQLTVIGQLFGLHSLPPNARRRQSDDDKTLLSKRSRRAPRHCRHTRCFATLIL